MKKNSIKKFAALLLSAALSTSFAAGNADWVRIWKTKDGTTSFVDNNTPAEAFDGGIVVKIMTDYEKPLALPTINSKAFSTVFAAIIVCKNKSVTLTRVSAFAGHKATGKELFHNIDQTSSTDIEQGSMYNALYENACLNK